VGEVGFVTAAAHLRTELEDRFAYLTDPNHARFEPIYMVATALDPRYRLMLNDDQNSAATT